MGLVYEEITLKNGEYLFKVKHGLIKTQELRQITLMALVDTGTHGDEVVCLVK